MLLSSQFLLQLLLFLVSSSLVSAYLSSWVQTTDSGQSPTSNLAITMSSFFHDWATWTTMSYLVCALGGYSWHDFVFRSHNDLIRYFAKAKVCPLRSLMRLNIAWARCTPLRKTYNNWAHHMGHEKDAANNSVKERGLRFSWNLKNLENCANGCRTKMLPLTEFDQTLQCQVQIKHCRWHGTGIIRKQQ